MATFQGDVQSLVKEQKYKLKKLMRRDDERHVLINGGSIGVSYAFFLLIVSCSTILCQSLAKSCGYSTHQKGSLVHS